jgi:putative DNA primase/helicase
VAIVSDARLGRQHDLAVITERLLSISGEDAPSVDRKFLSAITTKLNVRFVILTNELPRLNDAAGAVASRFIILRFTRSWYGCEDTTLTGRLLSELPGILLWSIEGWRRLRERGHFIQPKSGRQFVADMEDLTSPVGAFVREWCHLGPNQKVGVGELFAKWQQWCQIKGRKDSGSEQSFGRDLRAVAPGVDVTRPRDKDGTRTRVYTGIGLFPKEGDIKGDADGEEGEEKAVFE